MQPEELHTKWLHCLELLKDSLTDSAFRTWFAPIRPVAFESGTLVLLLGSQTMLNYIEENYIQPYSRAIFHVFGPETRVEYRILIDSASGASTHTVSDRVAQEKTRAEVLDRISPIERDRIARQQLTEPQLPPIDSRLNPSYTFESFVDGDCNKLVRSVGQAASKAPGTSTFNPLFIYGGSGVGKTHLMNAIGNQIKLIWPNKRVLYLSANEFKTQFMDAGQRGQTASFLHFYQTIDVLLIDDIQFLAGPQMQKTQEQFFHIFNYLQQSQKQIVMSSDRAPVDIKDVDDRLLTRFRWGFQGELQRPDYALRKGILRDKMRRDGVDLPDEVVDFIAENIRDNVRDLEGVLASLLAHSLVMDSPIDLALAASVVEKIAPIAAHEVSIDDIVAVVCAEMDVPTSSLMSSSRLKTVSTARMVAMYLANKITKKSLVEIGNYFGRTHATVIHAIKSAQDLSDTDQKVQRHLKRIENKLQS